MVPYHKYINNNARGIVRTFFLHVLCILMWTLIKIFMSKRETLGRYRPISFMIFAVRNFTKLCDGRSIPPDVCYENILENAQTLKVRIVYKTWANANETFLLISRSSSFIILLWHKACCYSRKRTGLFSIKICSLFFRTRFDFIRMSKKNN